MMNTVKFIETGFFTMDLLIDKKSYKLLDSPSFEVSLLVSVLKRKDQNIMSFISFLREHSLEW